MKRNSMSKEQKAYMLAKAELETIEAREKEMEREFIIKKGIKNPDGTIPEFTWCIDDDETANKAIDEFGALFELSGLQDKKNEARENLKQAENSLIAYGLSTMPKCYAAEKETLEKAAKTNYTTRQKLIELTFHLDASTVN